MPNSVHTMRPGIKSVLTVTIPIDTALWLREESERREKTIPQLVREIIEKEMQRATDNPNP